MSSPTVSYILAVYNGRKYLAEALQSIRNQSRPVDEIIVVDDGSTDDTADIAERLGQPVRCIRQKNAGQSTARNHGVRASRGEMLAFLDCDDLIHPKKVERQLQCFAQTPQLMLVEAYAQNFWSPDVPEDQRQLDGLQSVTHSFQPFPAFIGTWLFRREVWQFIGEFDVTRQFSEDADWRDRVRASGMATEALPAVLARRRLHQNNLTRSNYDKHIDGIRRLFKERITRRQEQGRAG